MKKKEVKLLKSNCSKVRARYCVSAHTCTGDENGETDIQRDRLGFRKKSGQKAFAHMFISDAKPNLFFFV